MLTFVLVKRSNHPRGHIITMARSRVSINPLYRGGAGGYSFYVRDGEQVVRQRKNNSNYGASASRTYAQMIRRIKWGNLINVYKTMKFWQSKAYESKKAGQTDYNVFMQLNTSRSSVSFTKEMNEAGCEVVESLQVSKGSLPTIGYEYDSTNSKYVTNLAYNSTITGTTTLGAFSTELISSNPSLANGDNIAFILYYNWEEPRTEFPHARCTYQEITLNTQSTALLSSVADIVSRLSISSDNVIQISFDSSSAVGQNREVGIAIVRTRKVQGSLQVSSQAIVLNSTTLIEQYSTDAWYETCIASFGLEQQVPLDPNFNVAPSFSVTMGGSALPPNSLVRQSQILRITSDNTNMRGWSIVCNNVNLQPVRIGVDYVEFLINENGLHKITYNSWQYFQFQVQQIGNITELPTSMLCGQVDSTSLSVPLEDMSNVLVDVSCDYLAYDFNENIDKDNILAVMNITSAITYPLAVENCVIDNSSRDDVISVNFHVTDSSKPAYIRCANRVLIVII